MNAFKTLATRLLIGAAACAALGPAWSHGGEPHDDVNINQLVAQARLATARFKDVNVAIAAGYTKFPDQSGDCVSQPGQGGMGIHYVNSTLLLDPKLDPLKPEFLVYQEKSPGVLELVALEYVVFQPDWDALNAQPPQLFGHPFHLVRTPNRYNTPSPFYELHVWAWEYNPNGLFQDWNPRVGCL